MMALIHEQVYPTALAYPAEGLVLFDARDRYPEQPDADGKLYERRDPATIIDFVVHHAATPQASNLAGALAICDAIQRHHQDTKGWPAIGYTMCAWPGGLLWVNGLNVVSYHVAYYNVASVGLCLLGDYEQAEYAPWIGNVVRAAKRWCELKVGHPLRLWGHAERNPASTAFCPSRNWQMWKAAIEAPPEEDEMVSEAKYRAIVAAAAPLGHWLAGKSPLTYEQVATALKHLGGVIRSADPGTFDDELRRISS